MKVLLVPLLVVAFWSPYAHGQIVSGSVWQNSRGSVLRVTQVHADGRFEGQYINNADGFSCKGTPFSVTGWINGNAVGWIVNWKNAANDCKSITSWSGVLLSNRTLETHWSLGFLTRNYGPRIMIGSDYFTRKSP